MSIRGESSKDQDRIQDFLQLYAACQHRIYGFILSYVADWNEADDIYQETLCVLWKRFGEYVPGTDFLAWAFQVARFQVLAHWKRQRSQGRHFSQATLDNLHEVAAASVQDKEDSLQALRRCISRLSEQSRQLLMLRYTEGATVQAVSKRLRQSVNTLYKEYGKIHTHLFRCVRRQLEQEA